jgi:acetyltransferase
MKPSKPLGRLQGLLHPNRIAIVGASERNHYAASLIQNLQRFNFPSENLFLVNPRYETLLGRPCYPRLTEIPSDIDLAVLAIPSRNTLQVLQESVEKKIKAALLVASGFGEFDDKGLKLQEEISEIADRHSISICGPNTLGFLSTQGGVALWSSPLPKQMQAGPIGAVFHSSGLLNLLFNTASDRCVGFRYAIAAGNEADLGLTDYLTWMIEDPEVKIVITLIESIKNPEEMMTLLDLAGEKGKPVVALRVGRSPKGSRAIESHTGNLATSGAAWQALFRQKGVISVDNMDQMLETAVALVENPCQRLDRTPRGIGIVTISGGDCSYLSDICERIDLGLPDPSTKTYQGLAPFFGKVKFNGNPMDIEDLHQADESKFYDCLKVFLGEEAFDLVCCRLNLPKVPNERLKGLYTRCAAVAKENGKGIVFLSRASEHLDRSWFEFFSGLRVPFLLEYEKSLRAVRDLLWWTARQKPSATTPEGQGLTNKSDIAHLRSLVSAAKTEGLNHHESRQVLAAYEIPLAEEALTQSPTEALQAAKTMGFPVVMKVISPDLPHKTEVGALLTHVQNGQEVEAGFHELSQRIKQKVPGAAIEGILVQKMVLGIAEVIVGTTYDRQLGPVVLFGLGGIYAEILRDVSLRLPPLFSHDIWEMMGEVKGSELLRGARGGPKADQQAVGDIILKVSQMASDLRQELETVELNPLIVLPQGQGAVAVDTLLRRRS